MPINQNQNQTKAPQVVPPFYAMLSTIVIWSVLFILLASAAAALFSKSSAAVVRVGLVSAFVVPPFFKVWLYFFTPAFTGTFGGYNPMIVASIAAAVLVGAIVGIWASISRDYDQASAAGGAFAFAGLTLLLLLVVYGFCWVGSWWGSGQAKQWAELSQIRVASPDEKLPPSNPDRIQMVTDGFAHNRGQQAITQGGQELSTMWKVDKDDWVRLTVEGKSFFVAPLVPASGWKQFWGSVVDSPGFMSVDAEDPNGEVKLHTKHSIKQFPDGYWSRNLHRHVYNAGYTDGVIEDAGLEVDDAWAPFYTMVYTQPKFTTGGDVIKKVIVVDANTGAVTGYDADKAPVWVDRLVSEHLVTQNAEAWAKWQDERARNNWPNFGTYYENEPADKDLIVGENNQFVWAIPMKSRRANSSAGTGLLMHDMREAKGVFYPGISGIGVGDNVKNVFEKCAFNVNRHYTVRSVQFYAIYGEPTYVAIYVQDHGELGETFAAIGMLHASDQSGANVICELDKPTALAKYASYIAGGNHTQGSVSRTAERVKPTTAVIRRIGKTNGGDYSFRIVGDERYFRVAEGVNSEVLPTVEKGDTIEFSYIDTGDRTLVVRSFKTLRERVEPANEAPDLERR